MKPLKFLLSLVILFCVACEPDVVEGQKPGDGDVNDTLPVAQYGLEYLYDMATLAHITINVAEEDWNDFLSYYDQNPHNEEYIPASFKYEKNGEIFGLDSIGIRLRGNTSRRRPEGSVGEQHSPDGDWHHAHFGVKFDEYVDDQTFCTADRIYLKWHKDDANYCREVYCYDLFRRFGVWSAPRACYTRLSIFVEGDEKPVYMGVYALIEGMKDSYLRSRVEAGKYTTEDGFLWKASWGANLSPNTMTDNNMGVEVAALNPSESETYIYDLKTKKKKLTEAREQLKSFVNDMNVLKSGSAELKAYLESRVDVDLFLRAYAVNVAVGMWDDYWCNMNNYYFYFDGDKFIFIPFDYDNTLGTSSVIENSGTHDPLHWGSLEGDRVLMRKVMSIPEYKAQYVAYLKELVSNPEYFEYEGSLARIRAWHDMIGEYVSNDTEEDMAIEDRPASWGNCYFYRLFSGNDQGGRNGEANFFKTKIRVINELNVNN